MIINAGLEKLVSNTPNGLKVYEISDWVDDWKKNDLLDDVLVYGEKIKK